MAQQLDIDEIWEAIGGKQAMGFAVRALAKSVYKILLGKKGGFKDNSETAHINAVLRSFDLSRWQELKKHKINSDFIMAHVLSRIQPPVFGKGAVDRLAVKRLAAKQYIDDLVSAGRLQRAEARVDLQNAAIVALFTYVINRDGDAAAGGLREHRQALMEGQPLTAAAAADLLGRVRDEMAAVDDEQEDVGAAAAPVQGGSRRGGGRQRQISQSQMHNAQAEQQQNANTDHEQVLPTIVTRSQTRAAAAAQNAAVTSEAEAPPKKGFAPVKAKTKGAPSQQQPAGKAQEGRFDTTEDRGAEEEEESEYVTELEQLSLADCDKSPPRRPPTCSRVKKAEAPKARQAKPVEERAVLGAEQSLLLPAPNCSMAIDEGMPPPKPMEKRAGLGAEQSLLLAPPNVSMAIEPPVPPANARGKSRTKRNNH